MSDEFDDLNSRIPDFSAAISQRISQKQGTPPTSTPEKFDPYQAMMKRKEAETAPIDPAMIKQWPEADIKRLQDYCERMGIVGFSCGRMHPIAALAYLRDKFGDDYTNVPMEDRIPIGHERLGTTEHNSTYPYSQALQKKQILHG